jgi:hypothetical protein
MKSKIRCYVIGNEYFIAASFFECNIANMDAALYVLDFYANYDHILVLDSQTGLLSVKY